MTQPTIQQIFDLAHEHHRAGRLREAEEKYREVLAVRPEHPESLHYLGVLAHQVGQNEVAADLIGRAIALRPTYGDAYCNLANVLRINGKIDEAIDIGRKGVALMPGLPAAHLNLGIALRANGQIDEAITAFRRAISLDRGMPEAHNNLGIALRDKAQLDKAIEVFREGISLNPMNAPLHSSLILAMHFHPNIDAGKIAGENRRWNQQHAEGLRKNARPFHNDRDPGRRLRVGYISSDFWMHASAHFLIPLFEHHDPSQVELFCYSEAAQSDAITLRLQQRASQWRNIVGVSDEQAAERIREDRIDILVDLKSHTEGNRLTVLAHKPAPVQVTWLGYPGSTGMTAIDYRLSDPYLDPADLDDKVYGEKTIRLPATFWCYDPLDDRHVAVSPLPALQNGFITFGCLNNFCKINEQVLDLWAEVLLQNDGSRLLLLARQGEHRQWLWDRVTQRGIDQTRVEFVPRQRREKYLEVYQRIDIGLDSFPYNGHTTSLDSFWMGVPVITLLGERAVSRAGWSQLSNLGLTELAAHTPEQYVRIATDLARDFPRLQSLRSSLRQRMAQSPLMDADKFARDIEAAYRQMWQSWVKSSA